MRLIGYEDGDRIMIGALAADGSVSAIAERETFWRDPNRYAKEVGAVVGKQSSLRERPAAPLGSRVICVGLNYRKHAIETNQPIPTVPVIFGRWSASLCVDGDGVPLTEERYDWEGELAAVIGKKTFRATAANALGSVFGYCAFNDLSARTFQRMTAQFTHGKNAELSGPMSTIVTADEVGDPGKGLRLTTKVNGALKQDDTTADLIFPVGALIEHLSKILILNPGDLIVTGTPSGVGAARQPPEFLKVGDVVEVEVEKVGKVGVRIVEAPAPM